MRGSRLWSGRMGVCALVLALASGTATAQDARTVLQAATRALGAENLRCITYSGSGFVGLVGQQYDLRDDWPRAQIDTDGGASEALIARLFDSATSTGVGPFHLLVKGTNFQIQVWRALISIPSGCVVSYTDVANRVGRGDAVRAVAGAIAANSIGYLIPCHRVLRSTGALSGYRWGHERKRALLAWESASS